MDCLIVVLCFTVYLDGEVSNKTRPDHRNSARYGVVYGSKE